MVLERLLKEMGEGWRGGQIYHVELYVQPLKRWQAGAACSNRNGSPQRLRAVGLLSGQDVACAAWHQRSFRHKAAKQINMVRQVIAAVSPRIMAHPARGAPCSTPHQLRPRPGAAARSSPPVRPGGRGGAQSCRSCCSRLGGTSPGRAGVWVQHAAQSLRREAQRRHVKQVSWARHCTSAAELGTYIVPRWITRAPASIAPPVR